MKNSNTRLRKWTQNNQDTWWYWPLWWGIFILFVACIWVGLWGIFDKVRAASEPDQGIFDYAIPEQERRAAMAWAKQIRCKDAWKKYDERTLYKNREKVYFLPNCPRPDPESEKECWWEWKYIRINTTQGKTGSWEPIQIRGSKNTWNNYGRKLLLRRWHCPE